MAPGRDSSPGWLLWLLAVVTVGPGLVYGALLLSCELRWGWRCRP